MTNEFREKLLSIGTIKGDPRDKILGNDRDAYKRLRKQGLQPPSVDGCAELESKASTQDEIVWGKVLTKDQIKQARDGIQVAREFQEASEQ